MKRIVIFIVLSVTWLVGGRLSADEQRTLTSREANLPSPSPLARQRLAKEILRNDDLIEVLEKARAIIKTGFNAGEGYGEVWIRDLATFIELSCEVNDLGCRWLREFKRTAVSMNGTVSTTCHEARAHFVGQQVCWQRRLKC